MGEGEIFPIPGNIFFQYRNNIRNYETKENIGRNHFNLGIGQQI